MTTPMKPALLLVLALLAGAARAADPTSESTSASPPAGSSSAGVPNSSSSSPSEPDDPSTTPTGGPNSAPDPQLLPEPGALPLVGLALLGAIGVRRFIKRK